MSSSAGRSWPSVGNCADADDGGIDGCADESGRDKAAAIEGIINRLEADYPALVNEALSRVPKHRLRKEVTREIRGGNGDYKSRSVKGALKAWLRWLRDVEDSQLVFSGPDGGEATAPLPNSFSKEYLKEKYARVKDIERALVRDASEPHTVMLTLSGSRLNDRGDPRCPGDHLKDLKDSWHSYVRRELQRVMDDAGFDRYDPDDPSGDWWEYALVVEPHKSGYGHLHVAVFTSGELTADMFRPVMQKHVEKCTMAGSKAHEIDPDDSRDSAVSVNSLDVGGDYDPEDPDAADGVTNLGSYIAEYLGAAGDEIWDRPVSELVFYSLLWSTESRRIHFSQGANDMAAEGLKIRGADDDTDTSGWSLKGVRDPDGGEHEVHTSKRCKACAWTYTGQIEGDCPECGGELISTAADYMRRIRGIGGGDRPAVRT